MLRLLSFLTLVSLTLSGRDGGYFDISVNDPEVKHIVYLALSIIRPSWGIPIRLPTTRVLRAQKAVVAGFNYRIDIIVSNSPLGRGQRYRLVYYDAVHPFESRFTSITKIGGYSGPPIES